MTEPAASAIRVLVSDARTDQDSTAAVIDLERWSRLAHDALQTEGMTGELTLTFIDDVEMAELNAQYMGVAGPTDVLSFPIDGADEVPPGVPRLLGDIVVSPAAAVRQYAEHAGTLDDELALLVVHGVLHILGHDHAEPGETAEMRERELDLLQRHHWSGPAPGGFRQSHT